MTASTYFKDPKGTWNGRYAGDEFLFGTEPNEWLRAHTNLFKPGDRVLSVADGEGRNSVWLARHGCAVDAFDISDVGVDKARRFAAAQGVSVNLSVSNVENFAWPVDTYDGVVAIFIQFADPALRRQLFARIVASLKPGGVLVLQGYAPKQLEYKTGGPPEIAHLYTEPMLREAFADLDILEVREYEAELSEGARHRGTSALIGMVARRRE